MNWQTCLKYKYPIPLVCIIADMVHWVAPVRDPPYLTLHEGNKTCVFEDDVVYFWNTTNFGLVYNRLEKCRVDSNRAIGIPTAQWK